VRVVPGVELSANEADREVHMLGLHIERASALEDALQTFRDSRYVRAQEIIAKLNALGIRSRSTKCSPSPETLHIGRPHLARVLIEGGWARDSRDAFDRYLGAGRPAYVGKHRLSVGEAIELVHAGGGLAVLAHPGPTGRRELVERFVGLGLDGLEVRHPGHSNEDATRIGTLVEFFGLVPSGGSDWHGASDGPRVLGAMRVPLSWLEQQDARAAARRAAHVGA
jgi:predicted metal-dependent phosphoesterase TrpH